MEDTDRGVELWPRMRTPLVNQRVVGPIYGAYHAVKRRLDLAAHEVALDGTEAMVLDAIRVDESCPPWIIRHRLGLNRSTLSSVLDRLEADGRLRRPRSAYDGRRFELRLTPAGRTDADLAAYVVRSIEDELAGYTSPEERAAAVAVFEACLAVDRPDRPVG